MKRTVGMIAAGSLAAGLTLGLLPGILPQATPGIQLAHAAESEVSFDEAREKGAHTTISDKADLYVFASSETDHTGKLELQVWGKLKMPYTSQDVDVTDTDSTFMRPNQYMKTAFEWAGEPGVGAYDKTLFKSSMPVYVDKNAKTIKLSFQGEEFDLAVPSSLSKLDVAPLAGALAEHRAEYEAAKNAGMLITPESSAEFELQMREAEDLLARTAKPDTDVTQQQLSDKRESLNQAFAKLVPLPFDRGPLQAAIARADKAIGRIPELAAQGKGWELEGYNRFYSEYLRAKKLVDTPDLTFIVGPRHGGGLHTQRDFDTSAKRLGELTDALSIVDRKPTDTSTLRKAFDEALSLSPDAGRGWEPNSGKAFYDALSQVQDILNSAYPSEQDVARAQEALRTARQGLVQRDLDPASAYTMTIRYRHHADNAPSELIDSYFTKDGDQVKKVIEGVLPGSEQRIYLDDLETIKKFDGYVPTTFFYASDDGTLGKVRAFTGSDGRTFILFTAERNGDLDIKYERGTDTREAYAPAGGEAPKQTVTSTETKVRRQALPQTGEEALPMAASAALGLFGLGGGLVSRRIRRD